MAPSGVVESQYGRAAPRRERAARRTERLKYAGKIIAKSRTEEPSSVENKGRQVEDAAGTSSINRPLPAGESAPLGAPEEGSSVLDGNNDHEDAPETIPLAPSIVEYPPIEADSLPFVGINGHRYLPGMQFLPENEWQEPKPAPWMLIDYDAQEDEWTFNFKRHETFSIYSEFQSSIGMKLGSRWDRELHGWRFPATTYNIKDMLEWFEKERKYAQRYNFSDTSHWGIILQYFTNIELTPMARNVIEAKRNLEERWELLQNSPDAITSFDDSMFNTKPEPQLMKHQQNGIEFLLSHDAILADEQGTAKTRQILNVGYKLFEEKQIRRMVVVCPATVKGVWRTQAKQYFGTKILPIMITGAWDDRLQLLRSVYPPSGAMPVYIISYGIAMVHPVEMQSLCDDGMLVLDEAHKIKSGNSKTTKVLSALKPLFKKALTGTPVVNYPQDAWTLFNFVKPGILGRTFEQFFQHFCYRKGRYGIGYRNLEEFNKRIQPYYIRRLKKNVLDLPEKTVLHDYESIEMGEQQKKLYKDMAEKFIAELESVREDNYVVYASNVMARLLRLLQICDGYLSAGVGQGVEWVSDAGKVKVLNDLLEEYCTNGRKVVIWSRFLPPLEMLSVELRKYNPVVLHGGVKEERRGVGPLDNEYTVVGKFWHDNTCKVFLGQIHTGGVGIDLSCADTCIFYDQWWSPGINSQAEDRLHRMGQRNPVTIIPLVTARTIEEYYFAEEYEYNGETERGLLYQKKDYIEQAIEGVNTIIPSKAQLIEWLRRI